MKWRKESWVGNKDWDKVIKTSKHDEAKCVVRAHISVHANMSNYVVPPKKYVDTVPNVF